MLGARIITGLIFGGTLTLGVLFLPTAWLAIVLGALWLAGAWEWARLGLLTGASRLVYALVIGLGMAALYAAGTAAVMPTLIVALVGWTIAAAALFTFPRSFSQPTVLLAGAVVLLPSWFLLIVLHASGPLGRPLALLVFGIVWAADVGAYGAGRWLGRVKLAPAVSPGKTWEGVGGGLLLAAAVAVAAAAALGLPPGGMVALCVATALISVVGDLTVSMFKRNVGVKDTGALLPGHGGVMDRIDSLTAAVPVFMLGMHLTGHA